ncbi:uncharacterized protein LOC124676728 [Lolium rigidum]|uniref:uncharacterized protein LOC124676728 n=1 Tax=Lolium rigidum TaxID=89674 RepID=UPI001F5D6B57|nr:uncharacterized protein LOC124676728 [Lolium rigidum]
MKRKGGDGGRRATVFDRKDAGRRTSEGVEMEDLCSKLTSLVPQEYRLDTASQGSSDMPTQLTQATTYIKDLRERVEKLKQRRDQCLSKVQRATSSSRSSSSSSSNATNTVAATGSSSPHDTTVQFSGATHFNLKFTMSSRKGVQLHKVILTILQDERVEVIEANSSYVDDSKIVYMLKCKATSSEAVLDASMVATSLRMLLAESFAESDRVGL